MRSRSAIYALALIGLALLAAACGAEEPAPTAAPILSPQPLPTLMPTPTGAPAAPAAVAPPADTGWQAAAPGVEHRRLRVSLGELSGAVELVRVDPARASFQVGYAPDAPLGLDAWIEQTGALAAINGGFFDELNRTVALLVRAGTAHGESYVGRGGMFAISPGGGISLRALADAPYDPAEPLAEAIQGWPMLVRPGGGAAYSYEDGERARRSALALDRSGRVLLIACPSPIFTLRELSEWLAGGDLEIDAAVNLDGGSSTGMLLRSASAPARVDPFVPLPIVLLVLQG